MKQYVVDAFTDRLFHGNQAAICVLDNWLSEELMLNIAVENNFSETAFIVKEGEKYHLRWFTPGGEIDLCGHATLASAYVLYNFYDKNAEKIVFTTLSGELIVTRKEDRFEMVFPCYALKKAEVTEKIAEAYGAEPIEVYMSRDILCVFDDEAVVRNMKPDLNKMKELDGLLQHATAPGKETDCVSRTFAPKLAVDEDPVCGSGHCHIAPYWTQKLDKDSIIAYQASKRGGTLYCTVKDDKVFMSGNAVLFSVCELNI